MVASDDPSILEWPPAPQTPRLESGEAHLWAASSNDYLDQLPKLEALLAPAERHRADSFKFSELRNRFVIRRGLLRILLSRYLEKSPSEIDFCEGAYGKPEVQLKANSRPLFFNASHSADIAVWAFTSAGPIGIDVEHAVAGPEVERVARHFFLPRETQTLLALPADSQLSAFFACWTRKEAFLKATGEGIAEGLAKVEVTLVAEDAPEVVSIGGNRQAGKEWQLQPFVPAASYVGCVAYRGGALALRQWSAARSCKLAGF